MTTMICLLIDVKTATVTETTYQGLEDLQRMVGGYIESAYRWDNGDTLFVDEEGLLKGLSHFFRIPERPDQALAGNGVLVGLEVEGPQYERGYATLEPTMTADRLREIVRWQVIL